MLASVENDVLEAIDRQSPRLRELSHAIHAAPEIAYEEVRASKECRDVLAGLGFEISDVPGVETAFVAERKSGRGPCVAMLAEYDALPEIGHGCGHNLIAGAALGAGIGLAAALERTGGSVRVYGCPAEEGGGGKIKMLDRGVFAGVDAAITFHAWNNSGVMVECTGQRRYDFTFHGRASHVATDPWLGASALEAVVLLFSYVNALRQTVRDGVRLHGIVTDGGSAVNVVPDRAQIRLGIRSADPEELARVDKRVQDCAAAAAMAAGVELEVKPVMSYEPVRFDAVLGARARAQLLAQGIEDPTDWHASASTDFGNVSQVVPSVLIAVKTWDTDVAFHTREAAVAAAEPMAQEAMLTGARAMALVGLDVLLESQSMT